MSEEKYKYKNEKSNPTGSFLVKSTGQVQLISGFESSDNNQIVTWDKDDSSLNSVGLQELLDNWDPNPRYISIVSPSEPKKRPFKEELVEGDLWYSTTEEKQYTWVTILPAEEPSWVETFKEPNGFTGIVTVPQGSLKYSQLNFVDGLLKTVDVIDLS